MCLLCVSLVQVAHGGCGCVWWVECICWVVSEYSYEPTATLWLSSHGTDECGVLAVGELGAHAVVFVHAQLVPPVA
eukprot:6172203-Pyramimonas_sp.AAC.1